MEERAARPSNLKLGVEVMGPFGPMRRQNLER